MKAKSLIVALVLLLTGTSIFAQSGRANKFGVGLENISSSPNLMFKYYASDNFSMDFILGADLKFLGADAPVGQTKVDGYNLRFGLAGSYYFNVDKVSPYLGLQAMLGIKQDAGYYDVEPDPKNNLMIGLIFGADYFLVEKFSVGIKQNLGFDFQLSRDIPKEETDVLMNTKTELTARFYF